MVAFRLLTAMSTKAVLVAGGETRLAEALVHPAVAAL